MFVREGHVNLTLQLAALYLAETKLHGISPFHSGCPITGLVKATAINKGIVKRIRILLISSSSDYSSSPAPHFS